MGKCRICLKSDLLMSIYSPTFLVRPVEMIEKLNIFKVEESLSTLLCQSCLYRLLDAYNLKQLADSSEHRLRGYVCPTGGETFNVHLNMNQQSDPAQAMMYDMCDIFDNVNSNEVEVEAGDVEIDVSSLTRSEAGDTLTDVFVGGDNTTSSFPNASKFVDMSEAYEFPTEKLVEEPNAKPRRPQKQSKKQKALKVPDKCLECGKVFNYTGYLEAHKRTHTGEKPYECKFCSRKFTQSSNLLLHHRTHTGERRFQCEICSSFFTTSSNLNAHRLTHIAYRAYRCADCEMCFKTKRERRRHESVHKLIKDIACKVCGKAFAKTCYLSTHMAVVHRGVRRHKCNECGKLFSSRSNLVCHMRTHSGEKPFQCKYCTWKFNQSSALGRHMKKHLKASQANEADTSKTSNYNSLISNFLHDNELVSDMPAPANHQQQTNYHQMVIGGTSALGSSVPLPNNYRILDYSSTNQAIQSQNATATANGKEFVLH